jgi:TrmH family RNA methyltransferase
MITSTANARIRYVRSLQEASARRHEQCLVIEGVRLVEEALQAGIAPRLVLYSPDLTSAPRGQALLARLETLPGERWLTSERALKAAADTVTPQGIVAVIPVPAAPAEIGTMPLVLVLDGLQDPGNLGTILRSAWAAGAGAVITTPGTADPYNPKVVRAGMGAHFHLALLPDQPWPPIARLVAGRQVLLAEAHGGTPYDQIAWSQPTALIIGSEAHGSGPEARALATATVSIPLAEGVDSLNAAVAASILLFEARRSRQVDKEKADK